MILKNKTNSSMKIKYNNKKYLIKENEELELKYETSRIELYDNAFRSIPDIILTLILMPFLFIGFIGILLIGTNPIHASYYFYLPNEDRFEIKPYNKGIVIMGKNRYVCQGYPKLKSFLILFLLSLYAILVYTIIILLIIFNR